MRGLVLLLLFIASGYTRANTLDSLYLSVKHDVKGNLTEVNRLITQLDAQGWADTLIAFTQQDQTERIEATLALYMAYSCYDRGMYSMSEELSVEVVNLCDKTKDNEMKSDALSHLATTYLRLGKLDEAISRGIEGLHIDSVLNDLARLSSSYNNIAAFCLAGGHPQEGKQYILKAISIEEPLHNPEKLAIRYGIASEIFSNLKEYDKALEYISQAYDLDKKQGNQIGAARRQSQMADIYLAKKEYEEAERLYNAALEVLHQAGEQNSQVITLKQLGRLYKETGRWEKCMEVLQSVDKKVRQMGNKYQLMQNLKLLAEAYMHEGKWREAAECSDEALKLNEEVLNSKMDQQATEYSMRFQMKELENQQLQEAMTKKGLLQTICFSLFAILAIVLTGAAVLRHRRKKHETMPDATASLPQSVKNEVADIEAVTTESETSAKEEDNADRADIAVNTDNAEAESKDSTQAAMASPGKRTKKGREKGSSALASLDIEEMMKDLTSEDDDILFRFRRIVSENLRTVDVEMVRARLGMSKDALSDFTNRVAGVNPKSLIQYCKMIHATHLLVTTNRTINDISAECGYYDNSYFGRVFSDTFGMTPGEYRTTMKDKEAK